MYRHFRDKHGLLIAVLENAASYVATALEHAAAGGDAQHLVHAIVSLALEAPEALGTYVRERRYLPGGGSDDLKTAELRIASSWSKGLRAARPGLGEFDTNMRLHAVIALVSAGALHPQGVVRPRLDELLETSAVALIDAPTLFGAAVASTTPPAWAAQRSRRDEILSVALRLFRERGFAGVGIDEIGAAAGLAGPTVYHYFPSKRDIVLDAYEQSREQVAAGVRWALQGAGSAADALERLVLSYTAVAAEGVALIVVTSQDGGAALPESERDRLVRRARGIREAWEAVLAELRPDLSSADVRLLVRVTFPLINVAVEASEGRADCVEQAAALALAHLRA